MRKLVKWWLPVVVWMIVIFVGSSIGSVPRVGGKTTDGIAHRVAHVLEFAMLGVLLPRALCRERPITRREVTMTLIVVALYGVTDEFHQRFTPGRNSEGVTVLFDLAGGALGVWVYRWWIKRKRASQRPGRVTTRRTESAGETPADGA